MSSDACVYKAGRASECIVATQRWWRRVRAARGTFVANKLTFDLVVIVGDDVFRLQHACDHRSYVLCIYVLETIDSPDPLNSWLECPLVTGPTLLRVANYNLLWFYVRLFEMQTDIFGSANDSATTLPFKHNIS